MYTNVLMADLRDLLNKSFGGKFIRLIKYILCYIVYIFLLGLPKDFTSKSYVPPSKPFCIIDYLCQHYDGITTDAKVIKEYFWKNNLKKLIERKVSN